MRSLRAVTKRAGCTINDIRTAVRRGEWHHLRKGAHVAVSHASGVSGHRIDDWRLDLSRIHVTRLDRRSGRIVGDVVQHERGKAELEETCAALHSRHRMDRLQPLVAMAGSKSGSVAESRGSWIFDQAGLPPSEQQWEVLRADGSLTWDDLDDLVRLVARIRGMARVTG